MSETGVAFPEVDGARSTSAFGRAVVADALAGIDPVGARSASRETNWRGGYLPHFRRLIEAGLESPAAARDIASAGVCSVSERMVWSDGTDTPVSSIGPAFPGGSERIVGTGDRIDELALPYRGDLLTGSALEARLDQWVVAGVVEPSVAESVRTVAQHPEWLSLPGHTLIALGAGSEIGPTPTLLRWGATVAGVDLRRPDIWKRVLATAAGSAGTLVVPATPGTAPLEERAGYDLLTELPDVLAWAQSLPGPLVLGNYLYADGGTNVRISAAADVLATRLTGHDQGAVLAYLATPTDVFAVPAAAVEQSVSTYGARSRLLRTPLRAVSGGRLLQRAYLPGSDPGICDSLVPQQGPNYALGKRMQRWRATAERAGGRRVSMNVAPPTRTRSVLKNRALAAAYAGAHRFGIEVFEPSTTRVLMAALLVHDLYADIPSFAHPWQEEAHQAAHGGLWRSPYAPRSALGLAALLGYGAGRS